MPVGAGASESGLSRIIGASDFDAFGFRAANEGERAARALAKRNHNAALALIGLHAAVNAIFKAALSRDAAADDMACANDLIGQAGSMQEGLEDVAAAVLSSIEAAAK